jgi:ketosteroid isomerase-like protein
MSAELIAFVESMDRCWIERRFDDLADFLARDIVMVPGGAGRMVGLAAAIGSYREFMARCRVERFAASDFIVTERGDTAIVEYRWDMAWESDGTSHEDTGRELLVLARQVGEWRVVWRTQLPGGG